MNGDENYSRNLVKIDVLHKALIEYKPLSSDKYNEKDLKVAL